MPDIQFIYSFVMLLTIFAALILLGMPAAYSFISSLDLGIMTTEVVGVSAACVVATGLPCAAALAIFGIANVFTYIVVASDIIKFVIFTPLTIVFIYIIAKLGRGTG